MAKQFIVQLSNGHTSQGLPDMESVHEYIETHATHEYWTKNSKAPRKLTVRYTNVGKEADGSGFELRALLGLDHEDNEVDTVIFAKGKNRRLPIFADYPTRRKAKKMLKAKGCVTFITLDADTREPLDETS